MKAKRIVCLLLALVMMFSVVGCGKDEPTNSKTDNETKTNDTGDTTKDDTKDEKLADKQELTLATGSDVLTMDPAMASSTPNWAGQALVYENLVSVVANETGGTSIVPGVAESWDVSDDGLVYTFHLRKDAKWADGVPVTAKDFEYTWRRTFDQATGASYTWMVEDVIKNGSKVYAGELPLEELGVKAIDESTLEITLESPSPFFLQFAGFPTYCPVREDLIAKFGSEYGSSPDKTVGNGPFILKTWNPGASMIYEKNDTYWNKDEVYLTKVTRQIIKEVNAVAQALLANEVDVAGLDNPQWNAVVDATGIYNVNEMPSPAIENFIFNCSDPILKNQKIRLAISLAFDREKYNDEALEKVDIPAYSMVPLCVSVGNLNYAEAVKNENEYIKALRDKNDPKKLLLEGMKELGLGDDPSKLEIHYMTRGTTEFSKKTAEWMKQFLEADLGIKFIIDMTEWNIMYDLIDSGDYQIAQGGWTADYNDPSNFLDNYHYEKGYYGEAKIHWADDKAKEYAKLVDDAKATNDDQERADLYAKAEKILLEQSPVSPQYASKVRTLVGKYVKGYYVNPLTYQKYIGVKLLSK